MELDMDGLIKDMGQAALPHLQDGADRAKEFGRAEAEKMARTAVMLANGIAKGTISPEEARLVLDVQRNASRSVLLTIKGLGIVSVEKAVNSAMDVVRKAIQTAIGVAF